jgi:hypothetical protein
MERVVPNVSWKVRAEVEGRAYRMVSFFHAHPSQIPEDQWSVWQHEDSKILIDKVTFAIMAECQCEFLTREADADSPEPTIVSVRLTPKEPGEEPL